MTPCKHPNKCQSCLKKRLVILLTLSVVVFLPPPNNQTNADPAVVGYQIDRYSIRTGGLIMSTGGGYALSGTVGQPEATGIIASTLPSPGYELHGGFWFPLLRGDCDQDAGVHLGDFSAWSRCATAPAATSVLPACYCLDFDGDSDVDLADFGTFQIRMR